MKYPSRGLHLRGEGGTVAASDSEFYGFCGIMLISELHWECARSRRVALNLPKMEQITTALLFNNGAAAWRLQISASSAAQRAGRPGQVLRGCLTLCRGSRGKRVCIWVPLGPLAFGSLRVGLLILFSLLFLLQQPPLFRSGGKFSS